LFFACRFFTLLRFDSLCRLASPVAAFMFFNFFIKAEKGRRRPGLSARSAMVLAVSNGLSGGAELRRLRKVWGKCGISGQMKLENEVGDQEEEAVP